MSLTLDLLVAISTLVLVVTGLFLIFGLLNVVNLANAGLMVVGVYAEVSFRGHGMGFWPSLVLAALVTGAVGGVIELIVIRRLYARPLDTILATWGVSLVLVQGITEIYGPGQRFLDLPTINATDVFGTPLLELPPDPDRIRGRADRGARADRSLHEPRAHDPRGDGERAARPRRRDQHRSRPAAHVHHRRRRSPGSPARSSARSRASTRTSARRSSLRASSRSCSRAFALRPRPLMRPARRNEDALRALRERDLGERVVIGVAVVVLRFRPQGLAFRRT